MFSFHYVCTQKAILSPVPNKTDYPQIPAKFPQELGMQIKYTFALHVTSIRKTEPSRDYIPGGAFVQSHIHMFSFSD